MRNLQQNMPICYIFLFFCYIFFLQSYIFQTYAIRLLHFLDLQIQNMQQFSSFFFFVLLHFLHLRIQPYKMQQIEKSLLTKYMVKHFQERATSRMLHFLHLHGKFLQQKLHFCYMFLVFQSCIKGRICSNIIDFATCFFVIVASKKKLEF